MKVSFAMFATLLCGLCSVSSADELSKDGCCKPEQWCNSACTPMTCKPVCKYVPIKKQCFIVECKPICIPAIRFPWEKCCTEIQCGEMKYVNVLKKHEYECGEKLVVEWVLEPCSNGDCKATCVPNTGEQPVPAAEKSAAKIPAKIFSKS